MTAKDDLLILCSIFGSCLKRSQGAGGNISVKQGNTLWIKASGIRLSSVSTTTGYVECDISKIHQCYKNENENLDETVIGGPSKKPSMETFFHLLPKSHIVHIHPTFFCSYLCSAELRTIFSNEMASNSLYIPYIKPGIQLAKHILPHYSNESIIFLENHGIILLGDSIESIIHLYEDTLTKLEKIVQAKANESSISIEYKIHKLSNQFAKPIYGLSSLPTHFLPISPDHFLFLQNRPLISSKIYLEEDFHKWMEVTSTPPSILQVDFQVYSLAPTYELCTNKEEYLRSYLDIYPTATILSEENQKELLTCPKEKIRLTSQ